MAEIGDTVTVIENPKHPYVQQLIGSIPVPDPTERWDTDITLPPEEELRGQVESGCRFYPRCSSRMDRCMTARPPLYRMDGQDHEVACYLYD
jgi:oligopeptide/dipeptide ABC transporter ATP-binding protein